ncbi:hypothetical protein KGF56_003740 [Candida oxycetoniae]|uniref:Uncharacterized protein n=1 Tax=Candida oxycetoniae TaxID=497107 RepID=A0AAI9SUS4_9ASCO|nr:uncharacterized protein KGF56_003740 [Candida oxycetoniae]KAI3403456.1 hypothetical protein KGF56_003740 [Candida oxycetoniae]
MISRLGLRSSRLSISLVAHKPVQVPVFAQLRSVYGTRAYSAKATIFDHTTGKTIVLPDPEHPEYGDYINPKPVLAQSKDPYLKYDDQQNRRNFNDPVNMDEDMLDIWSPDYFNFVSDSTALKQNVIFFGAIFAVAGIITFFQLNPEKPAMIRSFPYNGMADALGATSEETAHLYQVKPDLTAEAECGILPEDSDVELNRKTYISANGNYIN